MWFFVLGFILLLVAFLSTSAIVGGASTLGAAACFLTAYYVLQGGAQ